MTGHVIPYSGRPRIVRSTGTPRAAVQVERPDEVARLAVEPIDRRRGARVGPGPVVVVAHQEDPVGAGRGGGGRHPRPELVRLGRDRDLRIGQPRPERVTKSTDERPVIEHVLGRQALDVDVDAIEPEVVDEVDEDLDPARLGLGLRVELAVLVRAEARVHELDARAAVVRGAGHAPTDVARDPAVAVLRVVQLPVAPMRDGEQGQGREIGRADVVDDRIVHLPVRHEAVDLVTGDRHDRRADRGGGGTSARSRARPSALGATPPQAARTSARTAARDARTRPAIT